MSEDETIWGSSDLGAETSLSLIRHANGDYCFISRNGKRAIEIRVGERELVSLQNKIGNALEKEGFSGV